MELLEFKHKMFDLCGVSEISEIRDVLFNAVLSQDVAILVFYLIFFLSLLLAISFSLLSLLS